MKTSKTLLLALAALALGAGAARAQSSAYSTPLRPRDATKLGGIVLAPGRQWVSFANGTYTSAPATLAGRAAVVGTQSVQTGFASVEAAGATLNADASLNATVVTVTPEATAGLVTLKVWKPTSASVTTPVASTTTTSVSWFVAGR